MVEEVLRLLSPAPGNIVADVTFGAGGHAAAVLKRILPGGLLIGVDRDPEVIRWAQGAFSYDPRNLRLFHAEFDRLPEILSSLSIEGVDGVICDLGISTDQIEAAGRGFSFRRDEFLDMRMNPKSPTTAADLLETLSETALADLFHTFGEERYARRIARRIATIRNRRPIRTTGDLAGIVSASRPKNASGERRIHPATRVFMALRIAVNRELEHLEAFLDTVFNHLRNRGRIVILSFHSLEDRIVKNRFRALSRGCDCPPELPVCMCHKVPIIRELTKKPLRPSKTETATNSAAASARLRAAEKIPAHAKRKDS
jgi:16S rRNA (cytosine1402-N4)-methyltransferase